MYDDMSVCTFWSGGVSAESLAKSMWLTGTETFQVVCASCVEARECNSPTQHRQADEEMEQRGELGVSLKFLEPRDRLASD